MPKRLRKWLDKIPDLVWPHLTGGPEEPPQHDSPLEISEESVLAAAEEALSTRVDEATERFQSVEARLIPLLALASIIATVLALSVPFAISGQFDQMAKGELIAILIIVMYILAQIVFCLRAAVNGLSRRGYQALSRADLDPHPGESAFTYRLRLFHARRSSLWQNEWATNQKVSHMAVAHEAFHNILRGLALLIIAAGIIALVGN